MELKTLRCPSCNGLLEIEDGLDTFFCKYCGNKIKVIVTVIFAIIVFAFIIYVAGSGNGG